MPKTPEFLGLFSKYQPSTELKAALDGCVIESATINVEKKKINAIIRPQDYISPKQLKELCESLCKLYSLKKLVLEPRYPEALFDKATAELTEAIILQCPSAITSLAGALWSLSGDEITVKLKNNGADSIVKNARAATDLAASLFGGSYTLKVEAGAEPPPDALEQIAQQARLDALKQAKAPAAQKSSSVIYGKPTKGEVIKIEDISLDLASAVIEGKVFEVNHRETRNNGAYIISFSMMDDTGAIKINRYMKEGYKPIVEGVKPGSWLRVSGNVNIDKYDNEIILEPKGIERIDHSERMDLSESKRVELHLHTQMSAKDALTDLKTVIKRAANWGHKAIAITDHGVVHTFPDAYNAGQKNGIKVLLGCEGYFVDDVTGRQLPTRLCVLGDGDSPLNGEFVAFDLETTGLEPRRDEITEIGAVRYKDGEVIDQFQTFVAIHRKLDQKIIELTGITDDMLSDAPGLESALKAFIDFCGDTPLAAHNANFDVSFIKEGCNKLGIKYDITAVDTLVLSQKLMPDLVRYKLNTVADTLNLPDFNHHRAVDDARTAAYMLTPLFQMLKDKGIDSIKQIDPLLENVIFSDKMQKQTTKHIILIAKNQCGLRNLYKLVTLGHLKYFHRRPRVPKSVLDRNREGLIVGSACASGELFEAMIAGASHEELLKIADYYDFLEIQPVCNNRFLLDNGTAEDEEQLRQFNRRIVELADELGKPIVATGDVHFLDPEDEIYRKVLLASNGYDDADKELPIYFKTTDEMLEEFSYLGREKAHEVVVTNPNLIADMCETVNPLPKNLFAPEIQNSAEELKRLVYDKMERLYGENPPELIKTRINTELNDIIGRNYDVIYISAQKLVAKSNEDGYLVGSRGSVGSSMAAYMSGITEVNSLPPHYRCPNCKNTEFDVPEGCACGVDLPAKKCPVCGADYERDGFDIPFEIFLGFGGEKVPDIDLNFSGEYQAKAHAYTEKLFGETHVFRAGTIGTVAAKTAYGYAQKYAEERSMEVSKTEATRLSLGCVGVKRTTGQHPGGMVVIPRNKEIYDFCPAQHPADSVSSGIITTHFEYHAMEPNLLKLDILGHDDPTMIKMLGDLSGVDATKIPLDDPDTMSIFTSSKVLGFENDKILGPTGACAIPEFGTSFVRGMLQETMPDKFDTLVKISGFSHGTDVWLGNARDLITSKTATVSQVVSCRDDIMLYLISLGMEERKAFKIMEAVRKGKGLTEDFETAMRAVKVPDWYIESCQKIQYLFPKAHAVAYVVMAFRIAWFKVHRPLDFYAAYFSVRAVAFDALEMTVGKKHVMELMDKINKDPNPTALDKDKLITLEVCYEFYLRGFTFEKMDLFKSDAVNFIKTENGLIPPFLAVPGLGETAARNLAEGRQGKSFISIEEVGRACPKLSKTHLAQLKEAGAFGDMPETSQITLF